MKRIGMVALSAAVGLMATGQAHAINVFSNGDANALADFLLGGSVSRVGAATLQSVNVNQQGTFTNGLSTVGFGSGVTLSSGNINDFPGPNSNTDVPETRGAGNASGDDISTNLSGAGYAPLDTLAGFGTNDANVLAFGFQFGDGTSVDNGLRFRFTFASEEYVDYIDSSFNDVFGFFLDGVNVALVPGTSDPITINTVNDVENSAFYINNVQNTNGIPDAGLDIAFDGLTTTIEVEALGLGAGVHEMIFAVADTSDGILDAAVFIQEGSFTDGDLPEVPIPAALPLFASGLAGLSLLRKWRRKAA